MAKDIEEFLKMAAQRRRESAASPPPAQPIPPRQKTPPKQQQKQTRPSPVVVESGVEIVPPRRESVATHVQKHLDNSRLKKHAEKLGEEVGKADDKLDARLQQKFDHQVGHLTSSSLGGVETTGKAKVSGKTKPTLLNMLASPQNVQQAIVMSEILNRPEWD